MVMGPASSPARLLLRVIWCANRVASKGVMFFYIVAIVDALLSTENGGNLMTLKHNLISLLSAAVLTCTFLPLQVAAQPFVYQAVPYTLVDVSTGDEYTISGTFTTDCNDCGVNTVEFLDFDISVDGPVPFNFRDIDMGGDAVIFSSNGAQATPTEIIANGDLNVTTATFQPFLFYGFDADDPIVSYSNGNVDARAIGEIPLVVAIIPEPGTLMLTFLGAIGIVGCARRRK
jgi:hypothetical protein